MITKYVVYTKDGFFRIGRYDSEKMARKGMTSFIKEANDGFKNNGKDYRYAESDFAIVTEEFPDKYIFKNKNVWE